MVRLIVALGAVGLAGLWWVDSPVRRRGGCVGRVKKKKMDAPNRAARRG